MRRLTKGDHYNQSRCFSKVTSEQWQWTICLFYLTIPLIYIAALLIWQHLLNLCHNLSAEPWITIYYKEFRKWNEGRESSLERYYNARYHPFVILSALWKLVLTSAWVSYSLLFLFGKLLFKAALQWSFCFCISNDFVMEKLNSLTENYHQTLLFSSAPRSILASFSSLFWFYGASGSLPSSVSCPVGSCFQ